MNTKNVIVFYLYVGQDSSKYPHSYIDIGGANNVNHNSIQPITNIGMINDISKAINGEYTAIYCYELLANQAPNDEIKNRILEIRNDEIRHYETFWYLYISLTGKQPTPQITKNVLLINSPKMMIVI